MISSKMRYFSIFLFLLISLMLFCNICWAQNILFSLQYGQDDSQIGVYIPDPNIEEEPMGPSYFYVDSSGNFYITDIISNVIKKYGPTGNFILKTEPINSPLYSFCVDNEGNMYIIHGTSCDELTKFNNNGSVLWTKRPAEFNAPVLYRSIDHVRIINNYLYLQTSLNNSIKYIKIDRDGLFIEEVPTDEIDNNNNYYTSGKVKYSLGNIFRGNEKNTGQYYSGAEFDLMNPSGNIIKSYKISFPEEYEKSDYLRGIREWDFDSKGNIYTTTYIYRELNQRTIYSSRFFIDTDNFVFKFDKEGRYISTITFPASPFLEQGNVIFLDNNDDLYYLQFHEDKMDVVKVTSDNIPPGNAGCGRALR